MNPVDISSVVILIPLLTSLMHLLSSKNVILVTVFTTSTLTFKVIPVDVRSAEEETESLQGVL